MTLRFVYRFLLLASLLLVPASWGRAQQMATTNAASTAAVPMDASQKMIADAIQKVNANDMDGAISSLSQAIKLNPKSTGAYVLRGSLYGQKSLWPQAESDFNTAAKLAPTNSVLKFNVIELKFMQKQYDAARPGFVALEKDPDMGDFAAYKVFLCDLFGGHEAAAKKELDAFNDAAQNPSYYFSNAAWSLVHKNYDDARSWLTSAERIYPLQKNQFYAQSLRNLGYLPLPLPAQ